MNLILLGLPGAGKGTQAKLISRETGLSHIATGDIFRRLIDEGTPLGKKAKHYIDRGELVPDEDTIRMVKKYLLEIDLAKGFILDGFPRTLQQAKALTDFLNGSGNKLDFAVYIKVASNRLVKRLSGRRVCLECGASYHLEFNPPLKEGICDKCGSKLIQRSDDREETVRHRIEVHAERLKLLIDYYRKRDILVTVQGDSIDGVFEQIKEKIEVDL